MIKKYSCAMTRVREGVFVGFWRLKCGKSVQ